MTEAEQRLYRNALEHVQKMGQNRRDYRHTVGKYNLLLWWRDRKRPVALLGDMADPIRKRYVRTERRPNGR